MNIKLERRNAIKLLYKQGISIDDIQLVSGLSRKTIEGIVRPKKYMVIDQLLSEIGQNWNAVKGSAK